MIILKNNYRTMTTTCPHCKSVLQLDEKDVLGGDVCEFYYKCAACKKTAKLTESEIPRQMLP